MMYSLSSTTPLNYIDDDGTTKTIMMKDLAFSLFFYKMILKLMDEKISQNEIEEINKCYLTEDLRIEAIISNLKSKNLLNLKKTSIGNN